jgi:hypothetical protein
MRARVDRNRSSTISRGALARLGFVGLLVGVVACGGGEQRPICQAYDTLRDAVNAIDAAQGAAAANDRAAVDRQMDEVDRLLRAARGGLSAAGADPDTAQAARAMLEAANYLEYMTGQYRSTGSVDFSLTQFASRELTRAAAGAGGAPLNC